MEVRGPTIFNNKHNNNNNKHNNNNNNNLTIYRNDYDYPQQNTPHVRNSNKDSKFAGNTFTMNETKAYDANNNNNNNNLFSTPRTGGHALSFNNQGAIFLNNKLATNFNNYKSKKVTTFNNNHKHPNNPTARIRTIQNNNHTNSNNYNHNNLTNHTNHINHTYYNNHNNINNHNNVLTPVFNFNNKQNNANYHNTKKLHANGRVFKELEEPPSKPPPQTTTYNTKTPLHPTLPTRRTHKAPVDTRTLTSPLHSLRKVPPATSHNGISHYTFNTPDTSPQHATTHNINGNINGNYYQQIPASVGRRGNVSKQTSGRLTPFVAVSVPPNASFSNNFNSRNSTLQTKHSSTTKSTKATKATPLTKQKAVSNNNIPTKTSPQKSSALQTQKTTSSTSTHTSPTTTHITTISETATTTNTATTTDTAATTTATTTSSTTEAMWDLRVYVEAVDRVEVVEVRGDMKVASVMLKVVQAVEQSRDWTTCGLWWPDKNKWLTRSRSTLDQSGVTSCSLLLLINVHKQLSLQLPDLSFVVVDVDFSADVFAAVAAICQQLGRA